MSTSNLSRYQSSIPRAFTRGMTVRRVGFGGLLAVVCWQFALADSDRAVNDVPPIYECPATTENIRIDGVFDEATWAVAPRIELRVWDTATAPSRATTVRMAWDVEMLYLAYEAHDEEFLVTLTERDAPIHEEEVVEFFVDCNGDGYDYTEFEWNALGACLDLVVFQVPGVLRHPYFNWDAKGMRWASRIFPEPTPDDPFRGWRCEVMIPFAVFEEARNLPPQPGDRWRINHYRIDRDDGNAEYTAWSAVPGPVVNFHRPERFGTLVFRGHDTIGVNLPKSPTHGDAP